MALVWMSHHNRLEAFMLTGIKRQEEPGHSRDDAALLPQRPPEGDRD